MQANEEKRQRSTAELFAALSRVGTALMSELDETRLLHLIAETATHLTDASFAAFSLRPVNKLGQPLVPSEGSLFYLAAVVGVTPEQEALFRRMPLGGEGLLAPIFRYGVAVRVDDALVHMRNLESSLSGKPSTTQEKREKAREQAFAYAHGQHSAAELHSVGIPRGHPVVRSFLGAPLLDREGQVRGGLILGHTEPGKFTHDDETLLVGLASQAAVALENARLYGAAQMHAQELNAIFESIEDGVTLVDGEGNIVRENRAARQLRERLQSYSDRNTALETLLHSPAQRALHGEVADEMAVQIRDGQDETREYLVNASPLRQPTPTTSLGPIALAAIMGAVVTWHDVTETRRLLAERRVHALTEARRALLQLILDALPSSVYLVRGDDARLILANRASETVWGAKWHYNQPMQEFLAQNGIHIFSVDGRPLAAEQLATIRAIRGGEMVQQHQETIRHADGTHLPVVVNAVALTIPNLDSSLSDTTDALLDQMERVALVVHLDVTALKEAEHIKDEFIGIAAHELRNPLAILKGFARTLVVQSERGHGPPLTDWQMEAIQGIEQATARLIELTEDLLDVTRLQAGRIELHVEPNDMIALVKRMMSRLQMTTNKHTLHIHTSEPYCVVYMDPRRTEQVLSNLFNNAVKYSPEGGPIDITVAQDEQGSSAIVSIRDYGIGIPEQQHGRIFGRFARADNAQMHGIGGTGLGLYLSRELVERQGGRIWFESVEGQGATFFIAFPLFRDDA